MLENYLFTLQSMRVVKSHLSPRHLRHVQLLRPFLLDRYAANLSASTAGAPWWKSATR